MAEQVSLLPAVLWFCALFLGGIVKGTTGFGVPLIALPILSLVLPVPTAIVTLVLPIFLSNIYLIAREGVGNINAAPLTSLIVLMVVGIILGAGFLSEADDSLLYPTLGIVVIALAILNLIRTRFEISAARQRLLNPLVGLAAGIIGGMSTLMGPILIPYLSSLSLAPNVFVATIAFIYLIGVTTVTIALTSFDIVSYNDYWLSFAAIIPVFLGLWLGGKLRDHMTLDRFLFAIDLLLIVMGISLIAKG